VSVIWITFLMMTTMLEQELAPDDELELMCDSWTAAWLCAS
jgi:hypothetical protein